MTENNWESYAKFIYMKYEIDKLARQFKLSKEQVNCIETKIKDQLKIA